MSLGPLMASLIIIIFPPPVIVDVNRNKYLEFEFSLVKNVYDELKKNLWPKRHQHLLGLFWWRWHHFICWWRRTWHWIVMAVRQWSKLVKNKEKIKIKTYQGLETHLCLKPLSRSSLCSSFYSSSSSSLSVVVALLLSPLCFVVVCSGDVASVISNNLLVMKRKESRKKMY